MNGLRELSNIHDLQLLCCRLPNYRKVDEISRGWRYNFLFSIIRHPRLPPIFTVSPKVADNRGKTI